MCKNCRADMRQIISDLLNDEGEIQEHVETVTDLLMQITEKRAGEVGLELPEDAREQVRDALVASQIALAASAMASRTHDFTREGGLPPSMVLGTWAAEVMEYEMQRQEQKDNEIVKHLLGMGDN